MKPLKSDKYDIVTKKTRATSERKIKLSKKNFLNDEIKTKAIY